MVRSVGIFMMHIPVPSTEQWSYLRELLGTSKQSGERSRVIVTKDAKDARLRRCDLTLQTSTLAAPAGPRPRRAPSSRCLFQEMLGP